MFYEKLLEFLERSSNDAVSREEIMRKVKPEVAEQDLLRFLRGLPGSVFLKKNPIIYDRVKLLSILQDTLATTATVAKAAPLVLSESPFPPVSPTPNFTHVATVGVVDGHVVDATQDPAIDKFIPTRSYRQVERRMNPNFPMNIFIFGETGIGKSTAPIHIAKKQGRPVIRINLSRFTDVDDLFGSVRLQNGNTIFEKGPVLMAFEMGAILLMDEVDSADPTLLTDLHPILEHRGYMIKKLRQMVFPKEGFMVVATANTKGRGDVTGRYIGTGALNRAFLDRFATGIEYLAPTRQEIQQILIASRPSAPLELVKALASWYDQVATAARNDIAEHISPRKMLDIIEMMLSDGITNHRSRDAKDVILEATNLSDTHVSMALAELWDAAVATNAR
jgi:MoxR-like ATPase